MGSIFISDSMTFSKTIKVLGADVVIRYRPALHDERVSFQRAINSFGMSPDPEGQVKLERDLILKKVVDIGGQVVDSSNAKFLRPFIVNACVNLILGYDEEDESETVKN